MRPPSWLALFKIFRAKLAGRALPVRYIATETIREELDLRRQRDYASWYPRLKKAPTRLLLKRWLPTARVCGWYAPDNDVAVAYDDIKAELAGREHVPNKREAKASRRAAALMHRG